MPGGHKEMASTWLTNSTLVYGVGCGVSANEYSCPHGAQINFEDLTYGWGKERWRIKVAFVVYRKPTIVNTEWHCHCSTATHTLQLHFHPKTHQMVQNPSFSPSFIRKPQSNLAKGLPALRYPVSHPILILQEGAASENPPPVEFPPPPHT